MARKIEREKLNTFDSTLVLLLICFIPIFITPWWNFDPINLPRLLLLFSLALPLAYVGLTKLKGGLSLFDQKLKGGVHALLVMFITSATIALFFSERDFVLQLYGAQGRNTGFFAYVALIFLVFGVVSSAPEIKARSFLIAVLIPGISNLLYGVFQVIGLDIINWQNPYGPVVGMLGNPNFMSSFLGLFGIFLVSVMLWNKSTSLPIKIILIVVFCTTLFVLSRTNSIQGYFVLGFGVMTLIALRMSLSLVRVTIFFLIALSIVIIALLGVSGNGPLSNLLYQSTLQVRIFFWKAALELIAQRPFLGFGWDAFGDWYTSVRSLESAQVYGSTLVSNSSHNIFLDVGVGSGILCMFALLGLCALITMNGFHFKFRHNQVDWLFASSFSMWIGFLAQSFISVNSLALTTWGFAFGAIALSKTISLRSSTKTSYSQLKSSNNHKTLYGAFFVFIVGIIITFPPMQSDHEFRAALGGNRGDLLVDAANLFPKSDFKFVVVSSIFYQNNLNQVASQMAREALTINPRNVQALNLLLRDQAISTEAKNKIRRKIKKIDPFFQFSQ